jgi:hypothetical protein
MYSSPSYVRTYVLCMHVGVSGRKRLRPLYSSTSRVYLANQEGSHQDYSVYRRLSPRRHRAATRTAPALYPEWIP